MPDAGSVLDAGMPVDAGQEVDAGSEHDAGAPIDAGPMSTIGCADGTREGFISVSEYPSIAACSGAWSMPGVTGTPGTNGMPGPSPVPTCNRQGGNNGPNPGGMGCSSVDLCATGWHICQGNQEVAARTNGNGCADAVPSGTPAPGMFFAIAQHSCEGSVCADAGASCAPPSYNDNDNFGCTGESGTSGQLGSAPSPGMDCGVLNGYFGSSNADSCGWNQAMPNIGPWACQGSDSYNEGDYITKDGCQQNDPCMYSGNPIGPSDEGGVLCCQD